MKSLFSALFLCLLMATTADAQCIGITRMTGCIGSCGPSFNQTYRVTAAQEKTFCLFGTNNVNPNLSVILTITKNGAFVRRLTLNSCNGSSFSTIFEASRGSIIRITGTILFVGGNCAPFNYVGACNFTLKETDI